MLQPKEMCRRRHARRLRAAGLIGRAGLTSRPMPARVTAVVVWLIFAAGTLGWPGSGHAARLELVVGGLSSPLYVTHSRDASGRLFIVEQGGIIKVLQPEASTPTVFLDISGRLVNGALDGTERGLLGLAFHPQFAANRRFFVNYTRRPDGATVIAEYRASPGNPNQADPASERILLTVAQPFTNHNGGMVEFGPDELLYIALGDGGSGNDPGNRAQNPNDLLGKILRIDVDGNNAANGQYGIPSGNPFAGGGGRAEIYALGFRNPFRFSFDRGGIGALHVGDVGQGTHEEIDVVTLGGNYGWRVFEGSLCTNLGPGACDTSTFMPPISEYETHANGRCAVTGGYVYRGSGGTVFPGTYVFGDVCSGEIFLNTAASVLLDTDLSVVSFGEDAAGEILVVNLGGTVYRLAPGSESRDFNGDGTADILWRNTAGQVDLWLVNGLSIVGQGALGSAGPEWAVQAVGDFNGDGTADILWRHSVGQLDVWLVNGLSIVGQGALGFAGPEWTILPGR